jgi:Mrp family chromosome partitioning ATPase
MNNNNSALTPGQQKIKDLLAEAVPYVPAANGRDAATEATTDASAETEPRTVRQGFVVVPVADLTDTEVAPPGWWWDGYLPAGVVTLLGAHGGTGKSTVALMLAVSVALGKPLFGVGTRRGTVAYFSAEDGADLMRHRLRWLCRGLGVDVADVAERLHILDAVTEGDPALFHEVGAGGRRQGLTTPTYTALQAYVVAHDIDVLIVDNASDTFDGSEIDRAKVRGFMRALARIAQARGGAVLLLAHVDKSTSRGERNGTEGYSGSTAWHNSARSRLYLSRDKDGALLLEHQKHNLGMLREPLRLLWLEGGIPQADEPVSGFMQHIKDGTATKALLKLVHEFTQRGESVSSATSSRTHAGKLLRKEAGFPPRLTDPELFDLLRQAERRGWVERDTYRGTDRKERERWLVTEKGAAEAGIAATAATAATSGSGASGASGASAAATAATSLPGGVGERARTEVTARRGRP